MFGNRFFGPTYFGDHYFGAGSNVVPVPVPVPGGGSQDHYARLVEDERKRQAQAKRQQPAKHESAPRAPVAAPVDERAVRISARLDTLAGDLASREAELAAMQLVLLEQRRIDQENDDAAIALLLMVA